LRAADTWAHIGCIPALVIPHIKNQFEGGSTGRRIQKFKFSMATPLSMQNPTSKTLLVTPLNLQM
jgi:hypothetical protein